MQDIEDIPFETDLPLSPRTFKQKPIRTAEQRAFSSRRGKLNGRYGRQSEKTVLALFEERGWKVIKQGGPNRCDGIVFWPDIGRAVHIFSVECKRISGPTKAKVPQWKWPALWLIRNSALQALRQASDNSFGARPLLVFSSYWQGKPTQHRVYWPDGYETLLEFFVRHEDTR